MAKKKRKPPRVRKAELAEDDIEYDELPVPDEDDLNEPPESLTDYWVCIYGTKSAGKSRAAAGWPDSITLMAEPKRRGLRIRMTEVKKIPVEAIMENKRIDPWPSIKLWARRIIEEDLAKCVGADTIDIIYQICANSISARNGVLNPGKGGSDVWIELREEFEGFMNEIKYAGLGMVMLSHVKERDLEIVDGESMTMYGPSAAPACVQYIKSACDFAFFYGFDSNSPSGRKMVIRDPSNKIWTGCNPAGRFLQPDGELLNTIVIPHDLSRAEVVYETLSQGFNNELWDMNYEEEEEEEQPRKKKRKKR